MSSSSTGDSNDACEKCSSNFTLFKRKKTCDVCKQSFCQFCVNRQSAFFGKSVNSSDRICVICQSICAPETTFEHLLALKTKHLKAVLATLNISTNTCKEKRDLAELLINNRLKLGKPAPNYSNSNQQHQQQQQQTRDSSNQQQQQQQQPNPSINQRINNFFNNFQEFTNFNPTIAQPAPPPPPHPQQQSNDPRPNQTHSTSSSASTNSSTSSSIPNNLNNLFSLIADQVPTVLQQTLNSNFGLNLNDDSQRRDSSSSSSNSSSNNNNPSSQQQQQQHASTSTPNINSENSNRRSHAAPAQAEFQVPPSPTRSTDQTTTMNKRRASLSDLKSESDIDNLSVKQIKEILLSNFVEYKGCVERRELVDKVKLLYESHLTNKKLEDELNNSELRSWDEKRANSNEVDMCKICMEAMIDCVLLDCGHMVSCIKCGKRLAECPICRQNVARVVRVFKS